MCGATDSQYQIQQEQMQQYQQMQDMTAEEFGKMQEIYKPLEEQFQSIFKLGPGQKGFSDDETNNLNTQVVEGTAGNYGQAARAVNREIAATGGGDMYAPSGAADSLRQTVANSAAQEESREEIGVKQADYDQGYQEWLQAGQGLMSIAAGDNPLGWASATTNSGTAASETSNQIASQENSWINAAIGAAGAAAGGWAGGGFKHP